MKPSHRLVLNTAATYTRSLVGVGLALFSSRWVLNALGQVDYGLFSLVGSILVFIAFLNSVMAGSASRHFAYAIGQGESMEVNRWFNAALSIHLCLAVSLTLAGWGIGEHLIVHIFNVPPERIIVCQQVFRISLIPLFTGMLSIPFVAMFRAKQRIAELSVWDMMHSVLNFTLAWYLLQAAGDRLIFYALGMTAILVFYHSVQIIRAAVGFQECKLVFRQWFDKKRLTEIFSFAVWNLIGSLGAVLRDQGSAILLNLYFGPKVNASYGIAKQVSAQTGQLAGAMLGAFSPEITSREGRGDRAGMIDLSLRASKFGTLLVLVFLVPLVVEMEYVLRLWLVEPPQYTAALCRLILCTFLIDRLSTGFMLAINAQGRIAGYQATLGTVLVLTLPLAWLFLHLGFEPPIVGIAFIITMAACSLGRVLWARYLLNVPISRWVKTVVIPCGIVCALSTIAAFLPWWLFPSTFFRLVLVSGGSLAAYAISTWFVALDHRERTFFLQNIQKLRQKIWSDRRQP
ncbi:MAG: hypothetical protein PHI97_18550 [Desulfobulbus sp.]|nr:hypothetical protein [Desulfobulbus sp.]